MESVQFTEYSISVGDSIVQVIIVHINNYVIRTIVLNNPDDIFEVETVVLDSLDNQDDFEE